MLWARIRSLCAGLTGLALTVAAPAGANAAAIVNPSFEDGLTGWTWSATGRFGGGTVTGLHGLPTDGASSGRIYSLVSSGFAAGQYGSLTQQVDLGAIDAISFDAALDSAQGRILGAFSPLLEATFLVDGFVLWRTSQWGSHLNQTVDVSELTGLHTIEFRNQALANGFSGPSNWFVFDNLDWTLSPEHTQLKLLAVPAPAPLLVIALGLAVLGASWRCVRVRD